MAGSIERLNPPAMTQGFAALIAQVTIAPPGTRLAAISGQVAVDAAGHRVGHDHESQARQCFANLRAALDALEIGPQQILQMTIHVVGHRPELVPVIFAAGRDIFAGEWPVTASTWIGVESLAMPEWLVEIGALAVV